MVNGAFRAGWVATLVAALLASPASAQATRTAREAERARAQAEAEAAQARRAARGALTDIREIDAKLAAAETRKADAETALADAQARLDALDGDAAASEAALARDTKAIEDLVIAALIAERTGQTPHEARAAARMEAMAQALGPALVDQYAARSDALDATHAELLLLDEARAALAAAQAAIAAEQTELAALRAARDEARRRELAAAQTADRRARQYAAEARSLRDLAARVQPASTPRRRASNAPALGPLAAPVAGEVAIRFGQQTPAGHRSDGVTFRTRASAAVSAPANATVGYAGLFRSYGQILILNLEDGTVLVLAGLGSIDARAGDTVRTGQVLGRMADTATPAPELYVEIRRDGTPVDPSRRLAARSGHRQTASR